MTGISRRRAALALAGVTSLAVTTITAGTTAGAASPIAAERAADVTATGLDPAALQKAIDIQPNDHLAGVVARVRQGTGRWAGQAPDSVTGKPIPLNAHFRVGSISKTFVATIALQLGAEHVIDLDHTIQSYLPGLLPDQYQPITIRQLLNMTSGLPSPGEGAPAETVDQVIAHRGDYQTLDQLIQGTLRPEDRPWPGPHFAPGTEQSYNTLNYRIVADLIEKRTGHSYADELATRILRPLRLTQTFPDVSPAGRVRPMPRPYLHGYVPDSKGTLVDVSQQAGDDSGIISTPGDIDRFFTGLFGGELLRPAQWREMVTVPDVAYADPSDCVIGPDKGKACYALGLERIRLSNGTTLWGKTGHDLGYAGAFFRTSTGSGDGDRRIFYAVAQTSLSGGTPPTAPRLAGAMGMPLS
ncbi:beta-lactamase family protein [Actinoallomurus purpureus]|uniref:serine hydrolase domain-containing protein n=1 Tax=Actinoallomurus purpureus TaxID=478114 RepID=UPI0020922E15|nr:serine hydrolase domain-containing protein [Actinoallomurus purpureus]MCO6007245.1 beta-lactamase family protein [Actinoallomurus purpureus]